MAASSCSGGDGADPMALVQGYNAEELAIAGEFLTTWLPFLSAGLCPSCVSSLRTRVDSLLPRAEESPPPPLRIDQIEPSGWDSDPAPQQHLPFEPSGWDSDPPPPPPPPPQQQQLAAEKPRMSWADMAQEDELAAAAEEDSAAVAADDGEEGSEAGRPKVQLSREQREQRRFRNVVRKKDLICLERVNGRLVNILAGLELHAGVFSSAEQRCIVECVYDLQERGKRGELGDRTYSEPQKWMRGKGRVTIQFGCCYNYATDKNGNPPGIMRTVVSDPMPDLFKVMVKRLVRWNVLPTTCVPDSCIVNIYEPGDCIPPHIDSHDFVRPFCTASFLSECNILFGSTLKIAGPGEFTGSTAIPLPVGSVLVLNGNGADVAKHCVPAVPTKRISITFRRMDPAKRPFSFKDDPELLNITPLGTAVQEAGRSSDEGKSKLPDAQIRNLSKISRGKRSKGRTSAGKTGWDILGDQPPGYANSPAVDVLSQQSLRGQRTVSAASAERERNSAGRSRESRYQTNAPGMQSQVEDIREWPSRLAQERRHGNGMSFSEDGVESGERRPRMEHRQISMINRTINDEMDSLSISNRESAEQPRAIVRTIYNKPRTRVSLDD
ncbi:RNA demethylase ALKBH9B-like [Phragmites australis]|uniref:RNA demethylase ALKBH9B-like n=1 Tax=Phragmites australis TaxID=29695 RepID=UPI002D799528|nr:RNA demethylase ALKBH9B-like [Phragmites australis]